MDEALRYNQQLQFCKQLHCLQVQLCEDTYLSDELLNSLYALGKFFKTPACVLQQLAATYPEFAAKLQRSIKQHPLREMHIEQMEGDAVEAVVADAEQLAGMLQPMYKELQELGKFLVRASNLLADLHQLLIPVTMATAPEAIEFFMALFCNTTRIVLLMDKVPWKLLVQVYTIVTTALDGSSPPGRTAVCELLDKLSEPVPYLQTLFQPISSRVSQVLELAVSPVLDHVASASVLEQCSVFDVTRLGQTQLGITGMSLDKTYSFMQRLEDFRSWALLGFLACPAALQGVSAQPLMAALLQESFVLPVHGDVVLPLHTLYQQHVTPALEQLLSVLLDSSTAKASKQAQLADAKQLISRCYAAAVEGAEAEHAARRRLITRVLQDVHACLEDDVAHLPDALPMALAAQAYAKSELLWYFRHVGDKLPPPPSTPTASKLTGQLLGQAGAKSTQLADDEQVVALVAAAAALYDLLEEHQDALQGQQLATMRALLEQQVLPETAAVLATADKNAREIPSSGKERVVPKILVPLVKGVVYPLADLAQAEDVAAARPDEPSSQQQQQTPASQPGGSDAAAEQAAEGVHAGEPSAAVCVEREPLQAEADEAADPAAVLRSVQQHMVHLTMLLCSRNLWMRPAVLEAPAQDPQYLEAIHKLVERCPFAVCFMSALDKSCSLHQLVHYQHKLQRLQQHVLQGTNLAARDTMCHCPALVKVLHWFEHNQPVVDASGMSARDYAAEAKALACSLLEEQCGTVALFLTEMAQELSRELYVKHPVSLAATKTAPRTPRKGASSSSGGAASTAAAAEAGAATRGGRQDADAASAPDQQAAGRLATAVAGAGGAASASVRCRAVALAHALDVVGAVRVSSDRLVLPAEYLRAALQQCMLLQLNEMVVTAEVPPVPSQLVRLLTDMLWAAAELREVLNIDVTPELWQVLLNHAQPDWVLPPSSNGGALQGAGGAVVPWLPQTASTGKEPFSPFTPSSGSAGGEAGSSAGGSSGGASEGGGCATGGVPIEVFGMIQAFGEWYVQAVVRDVRGLGVMFAPQLCCFTCLAGPKEAIQQRTSLPELTALFQVFGPYAAMKLCALTDGVLLDSLGQLDSCLSRWKELLDPITLAVVRDECCLDAVASASSTLADEGQVLTQARQLSRCLAFRQLLSEALAQALASTFPAAGATVDAVASNMQLYAAEGSGRAAQAAAGDWGGLVAGRHVCDLFDLPRPGLQGVGAPAVADPVVVNTLVGSNNYERYKAWFNLPTLLGLSLQSPTISSTTLDLAQHSLSNELHALVHAAKCLALAQQAAANKVLPCGSTFLHPEAADQAASMLASFAKVAATTLYLRNDTAGVRACKLLVLEQHPNTPGSNLADAWVPACRVRSSLMQQKALG